MVRLTLIRISFTHVYATSKDSSIIHFVPKFTNLCPGFNGQLRDLNGGGIDDGHLSTVDVLVVHHMLDGAFEAFVGGKLKQHTTN